MIYYTLCSFLCDYKEIEDGSMLFCTFYLVALDFMSIFAEKYSILDYGAKRFDEGEARGAFADSAGFG